MPPRLLRASTPTDFTLKPPKFQLQLQLLLHQFHSYNFQIVKAYVAANNFDIQNYANVTLYFASDIFGIKTVSSIFVCTT